MGTELRAAVLARPLSSILTPSERPEQPAACKVIGTLGPQVRAAAT